MNFSSIMQLKTEWDGFKLRHPKFPLFLNAVLQKGITEDTVIEVHIPSPDGTVLDSNLKIRPEDLEMLRKMREITA